MGSVGMTVRAQFTEGDRQRDAGNTIPEDVERIVDQVYGADPKWQILDLYRPKGVQGKLPVIISFHGGGWVYGDKEVYQWYTMSLAQMGFAVINFTYRLAPEFQYPSPLEDMSLVVDWMYAHCEEYGLDTENVFGVGDSAGGHGLGLFSAICTNQAYAEKYDFKVHEGFHFNAIALNCGTYTIDTSKGDLTALLMKEYIPHADIALIQVPSFVTENFPPCFVMTCSQDFLKDQVHELVPVLLNKNVECECRYYSASLGHVFHCNVKLPEAHQCNKEETDFFKLHIQQ